MASARKKLVLNFPGDGNLILKARRLVFLLDKIKPIEPVIFVNDSPSSPQLVALLDLDAVREIHGLHILGAAV